MKKIGPKGLKWLKGFHLIAVSCWVGGVVALISLNFIKRDLNDGGVLYGINQSIHHVDMAVVVIPGAFGCLLTGFIYGVFTRLGFFRHGWMIFKWIVTIGAIIFGTFFLAPWETMMMNISGQMGLDALTDADYLHNQLMNMIFGSLQGLVLFITVFISIFKPWKNILKKAK